MSIIAAANSISKFSFNLHPTLVFLSRLRYGIRCFAAGANGSGLPVRYIPKKHSGAKPTQGSCSWDDSHKDSGHIDLGKRSTIRHQKSSTRLPGFNQDPETQHLRRHFIEDAEESQTHQGSFQSQWYPCNQQISYASGALDSEYVKVRKEVSQESRNDARVLASHSQWSELNQEMSCHDGVLNPEFMEASEEPVEEIEISEMANHSQLSELNQKVSFRDGVLDPEFMEASEEAVEEIPVPEMGCQGEQGWSKSCGTRHEVEKLAVGLLSKRGFTAMELRKKLLSKHFPLNIVEVVVHDFLQRGLINDRLYAETFCQSRWTSSSWGPRRVKHALLKKGVSETDAHEALKLVFEDQKDDNEHNTSTRLSDSSMEKLYMQASKQWQRSKNVDLETRKARLIRWLQYRGFDWSVVGIILKKLQSGHPP